MKNLDRWWHHFCDRAWVNGNAAELKSGLASGSHPRHFLAQGLKRNHGGRPPRIKYNTPAGRKQVLLQPHRFPHPPPDAVTHDRFSKRSWRRESKMWGNAGLSRRRPQKKSRKARTGHASPFVIHLAEVTRLEDARALRECTVFGRALREFGLVVRRQLWRSGRHVRR